MNKTIWLVQWEVGSAVVVAENEEEAIQLVRDEMDISTDFFVDAELIDEDLVSIILDVRFN